jgi:hypothetical protein
MSEPSRAAPASSNHEEWLAFYALAALLGALTPLVLWVCMTGNILLIAVLVMPGVPAGVVLCVATFVTGCSYLMAKAHRASEADAKRLLRALGLQALALLWLASLVGVGPYVERTGLRWSRERGEAVAAAVEEFRSLHGRYPHSLDEAELAMGRRFPRPFSDSQFRYHSDGEDYSLSFLGGGILECWSFERETGTWTYSD